MVISVARELAHNASEVEYVYWNQEEKELRAYLLATHRGMTGWFQERESAAARSVADMDPEHRYGGEAFDAFMEDTGVFWPDYWERTAALVIKEAFRIYEIFLYESAHAVARCYGSGLLKYDTEDTWTFPTCEGFYRDYLGIEVLPAKLEAAKWIRNKLTHLSDLTSEAGKHELDANRQLLCLDTEPTTDEKSFGLFHERSLGFGQVLRFTPLETWRILDTIRGHANTIGQGTYGHRWTTTRPTPALENLAKGIFVNPRENSKKRGDTLFLEVPTP